MLLPALGKARERARSASCIARQKQLSLHVFSYANDMDDWLLPICDYASGSNKSWMAIMNDLGYEKFEGFMSRTDAAKKSLFFCPADKRVGASDSGELQTSYGLNGVLTTCSSQGSIGLGTKNYAWIKIAMVRNPSEAMLLGDCMGPEASFKDIDQKKGNYYGINPFEFVIGFRHNDFKSANFICVSGNAKTSTNNETPSCDGTWTDPAYTMFWGNYWKSPTKYRGNTKK